MTQPQLYIIAGPNGAGKTTAANTVLPEFLKINEFVNADNIALGLSPFNPEKQRVAAGKLMIKRMHDLIRHKESFAFETTLASKSFVKTIKEAKKQGYAVNLFFFWLPSVDMAKARVRQRVLQGGHNIPEGDIKRRYKRGLDNLFHLYRPVCDTVNIYNAHGQVPKIIARITQDDQHIFDPALWRLVNDT